MRLLATLLFPLAALFVASCDSPSVAFMGAQKTQVQIGESTFSVHRREDRVEVYRTSVEILPNRAEVLAKAELAIMQATGCRIWKGTLNGDQALIKARLACGGAAPKPATDLKYECRVVDTWDILSREPAPEALDCTAVQT